MTSTEPSNLKSFHAFLFLATALISLVTSGCQESRRVYFVPIGDAPTAEINALVDHYKEKFGIDSQVLPPMPLVATDVDPDRQQLIAENLIQSMQQVYPAYAANKSAVLIGITGQDMYPTSTRWQFCFGWRGPRVAVVSTARMSLRYPGEPLDEATLPKRLRKVVTKDIGILYYGKSASDNPKSVLYKDILGIQELDQVSEDF